ncbi:MAG: WD40 repeat domain-containing protein, partial [Anaerolineae bacterium]|nr:WD40 repeat domain-containing protein [Anaerolineae bacterium]
MMIWRIKAINLFNFVHLTGRRWLAALLLCVHAIGLAQEEPILEIDPSGHSAQVKDVMFTPDGRLLISVGYDKTIRLWDVARGELLKTIRGQISDGYEGILYAGTLHPDGHTLAVSGYPYGAGNNGYPIQIFNIETGEQIGTLKGHSDTIHTLAFSRDGRLLVSGSVDNTVRIWRIWQVVDSGSSVLQWEALATLEGHRGFVFGVAIAPDGSKVVASFVNTLRLWRADSYGRFNSSTSIEMKKHTAVVHCVAWAPDGRYIVSGDFDGRILLWENNGTFIKEIDTYPGYVATVSFSNDSRKLVASGVGSLNFEARVYAVPSGTIISRFTKHTNSVQASAFYGNDLIATAGGHDNDIYLWEANKSTVKTHLIGKGRSVWAVAFGDGLQVAFGQSFSPIDDINHGPLEKTFDFATMQLGQEQPLASRFTHARTTYRDRTLNKTNNSELRLSNGKNIKSYGSIHAYTFTNDGNVIAGSDFSLQLYTSK